MFSFKNIVLISSVACLLPSLALASNLKSMTKNEVNSAFTDKTFSTISAVTLDGKIISDSFTGYISKDGTMMGKLAKKSNGEPQDDKGTWQVKDDGMFCFKWEHWNNMKEKCITMYNLENAYLIVNAQNGFETVVLKKDMVTGNQVK